MKIIRFIFPFLFVRNWHDGMFELSRTRLVLFVGLFFLFLTAFSIVLYLQAPVKYVAPTV